MKENNQKPRQIQTNAVAIKKDESFVKRELRQINNQVFLILGTAFVAIGSFTNGHTYSSQIFWVGVTFYFVTIWLVLQDYFAIHRPDKIKSEIAKNESTPLLIEHKSRLSDEKDIVMELEAKFHSTRVTVPISYSEIDDELGLESGSTKKFAPVAAKKLKMRVEPGNERFKLFRL